MTPVSRVPHGAMDFLWLMGHISALFELAPLRQNLLKSLYNSALAVHGNRQVKLAVGLL